jgi:hypothetical protein
MQATANEKQSASGGEIIANLYVIGTDINMYFMIKFHEVMLFFPFCPLSRKEKEIKTQRSLRLERP